MSMAEEAPAAGRVLYRKQLISLSQLQELGGGGNSCPLEAGSVPLRAESTDAPL